MADSMDLYEEHPEVFLPKLEQWAAEADEQVAGMLSLVEEAYD